jgi:acetyl-CoA C-acetyltransferase
MEGEIWHGINEFENNYKLIIPSYTYALFETALRYSKKRSITKHNKIIGDLFHKFSKIAAENPYAWTQKVYKSEEIITTSSQNRLINHPYTKRMCSNMFVDQSAAIIITSENLAKSLGIDQQKWVYPMGGADYDNIFSICQRPNLNNSPAARFASRESLRQAGLKIKNIDSFDIYSCFHSIVEIIKDEIGIPEEDERDLTITGGLPYFGGPWSNYSLHAIAQAVDLIREEPSKKIMVIANGGYNTKQSFGIYGKEPPKISWSKKKDRKYQDLILNESLQEPIEQANGILTVEGYTLIYNREGKPKKGIVIGTLKGSETKTLAIIEEGLKRIERKELVGCNFQIQYDTNLGYNTLSFNLGFLNQDQKTTS